MPGCACAGHAAPGCEWRHRSHSRAWKSRRRQPGASARTVRLVVRISCLLDLRLPQQQLCLVAACMMRKLGRGMQRPAPILHSFPTSPSVLARLHMHTVCPAGAAPAAQAGQRACRRQRPDERHPGAGGYQHRGGTQCRECHLVRVCADDHGGGLHWGAPHAGHQHPGTLPGQQVGAVPGKRTAGCLYAMWHLGRRAVQSDVGCSRSPNTSWGALQPPIGLVEGMKDS